MTICAVLFLLILLTIASAKQCDKDTPTGDKCTAHPSQLNPTQFFVGEEEVLCKSHKLESFKDAKLEDYLKERVVPLVKGPNNDLYLYDRHHMSKALLQADIPEDHKVLSCEIVFDFSLYSPAEFYSVLMEKNLTYLVSPVSHDVLSPFLLPKRLSEMRNDPYRSLAFLVREYGGFGKEDVPFMEFMWADFFRENIDLVMIRKVNNSAFCNVEPYDSFCWNNPDWYTQVLDKALELADSVKAKHLPGWKEGIVGKPNCGK